MRYAYAETTPSLNLAASLAAQIRGGWAEVGTTIAEHPAEHTHTHILTPHCVAPRKLSELLTLRSVFAS